MKKCSICEKTFPATNEYFYKNKSASDGLFPYCKQCTKERNWNYYKNDPEGIKNEKKKEIMNKYSSTDEARDDRREATKRWRERGKLKEFQKNNPDLLKEYYLKRQTKKHEITKNEWEECKKFFNNKCAYCGISHQENKLIHNQDFHKDHFSNNGANDITNCIPACKSCNTSKWKYEFEEWFTRQNFFNEEKKEKIYLWLNVESHKVKSCSLHNT